MINKEGFIRDILCSLEHFDDKDKAREYIAEEFKSDYSIEEIAEAFDEAVKMWEERKCTS